jgi:hypothetical protein
MPPGMVGSTPNAGGVATSLTLVLHDAKVFDAAIAIRSSAMFSNVL